jgi:hypothetical protein
MKTLYVEFGGGQQGGGPKLQYRTFAIPILEFGKTNIGLSQLQYRILEKPI